MSRLMSLKEIQEISTEKHFKAKKVMTGGHGNIPVGTEFQYMGEGHFDGYGAFVAWEIGDGKERRGTMDMNEKLYVPLTEEK